ncbi:MAG: anaerobic ribonucleoside-triphosphate reductase [Nitrososphaerales archaeon]
MSAPRRVRTIYSVIASPNRLDILRILNTKGPLSYSDLKTLAGFKSKKESGKFAYHLRKLVKQTLISLNRAERKYTVTSLGRLVLNLTRQIEEQSMLESGKLYVRSSRQSMEEFNSDRILQSLVNEAGMPVEIAQKIASETEARVYKFQTVYLTAPLIREIVNSILVEHGYEEYRHKLTRLGLPVHDVSEMMIRAESVSGSIDYLLSKTSSKVFSEYSMLTKIPRDVADAHLSGDIHISNLGAWSLMPDVLYFDLNSLYTNPINLGSNVAQVPRLGHIKSFDSALESLEIVAGLLSREISSEVCLDNLISYISKLYSPRSEEEQVKLFGKLLQSLSSQMGELNGKSITFRVGEPSKDEDVSGQLELRDSLLKAYAKYSSSVPLVPINLVVTPGKYLDRHLIEGVSSVIERGGSIALDSEARHTYSGFNIENLAPGISQPDGLAILGNLTLNLPRLAYESNKDETYFRAKLAILLQTAINALSSRKQFVKDSFKRGLLPIIGQLPLVSQIEDMPIVVNLVGLNEALSALVNEKEKLSRQEISQRILDTASKVASEKASKLGEKASVSMVAGEGFSRLAEIDSQRYGRSQESRAMPYQSGLVILSDHYDNQELQGQIASLSRASKGGCLVNFVFPRSEEEQSINISNVVAGVSGKVPFARFSRSIAICKKCGSKAFSGGRCNNCKSTNLIALAQLAEA